ncbi:MAG: ABC transporter permease [Gemmatimonadetes bacterium]|nr:ABC transporter permease [Gemmatimonadota bacterium]
MKRGRRRLHGERPNVGELPVEEDVRREVEAHLRMRAEELVAQGWDPEDAGREARRRFGDVHGVEAEMTGITRSRDRAVRRAHRLDAAVQDLKYALRTLARSPGFAVMAVLTLALGIGANTAVFSVVNAVLLRPLPLPEPDRLATVAEETNRGGTMRAAWPNVEDWRARSRAFQSLAGYTAFPTTVLGGPEPLRVRGALVGRGFWSVLPVPPLMGRTTLPDDHRVGVAPVAVVSYRFWQDELGGDPGVLERTLESGPHSMRIVGVMPPGFDFPEETAIWRPAELDGTSTSRTAHNWDVLGRLAPGTDVATADRELDAITARILEGSGDDADYLAAGTVVTPLLESIAGSARQPLFILLGAAGLVLLVACSNLASTLLARGAARAREMAVRSALGAGRGRLVRQLLTESVVLSSLGTAAGVGVAVLVLGGLRLLGPASLPRLAEIGLDGRVLGFTVALALLTAFLFGLVPALRLSRDGVSGGLRTGSRGNALETRGALWSLLVGGEMALALLLLAGSGLLIRSFWEVVTQDAGFHAADVLTGALAPSQIKYPDGPAFARLYEEVLRELDADPAVAAAAITTAVPVAGSIPTGRVELDGDVSKHASGGYAVVSDRFFEAMDIPVLQGRTFTGEDRAGTPHVAVVSRGFAERWWPGEDPVGRSVTGGGMDDLWQERTFSTVVGVVGDVRYRGLTAEPTPTVYFSYRQRPFRTAFGASAVVEARTGGPGTVVAPTRRTIQRVDPDIPLQLRPLSEAVGETVADRRFTLVVLGAFAAVALVLAMVGIYGVVSYTVARRTREMGIRLALGAHPGSVRRRVVQAAMATVILGLAAGAAAAVSLGHLMEGMLFEVSARDPLTLIGVVAILGSAALVASWIPATRSTRVDPMITMRAE